jgi:hypothetical protein
MIKIYDNAFSKNYLNHSFTFVTNSTFKLGWYDSVALEHSHNACLFSPFSDSDIDNFGILKQLKNHDVGKLVNFDNLTKCVVNLSLPGQTHIEHTHDNIDVIVYYVNLVWNREWAGETLFYSDNGVELETAVEYIPNRLVFFNGEHPHTIRPPSFEASFYRFTASLFFDREAQNHEE